MMRFLTKINRSYLVLFVIILMISSVAGYFILTGIIRSAAKESLMQKKELIVAQIKETGEIPSFYPILEVKKLDHASGKGSAFRWIMIQNRSEDEAEPYLEFEEELQVGGTWYSIKLRQSVFEQEDLVLIITLAFIIIISVSSGITLFLSRKINRTIWTDFEINLKAIEHFNLSGNKRISLVKSEIDEFDRLNRIIESMTDKLRADFRSLKEFTENASHEMQTPLSVALINLDEVLQQDLNEVAFENTVTAIQALKRLSSLNQSLITLAKIENRQYQAENEILMNDLIKRKLHEFETLFEAKSLEVKYKEESGFRLAIHEQLADLLINNLLSNAVIHNLDHGSIQLTVGQDQIKICNTGKSILLNEEEIFNRFTKAESQSLGLGLAIVKKICDTHHLEIAYHKDHLHCFIINRTS